MDAPDVVQNLHGSSCEIRLTKGDGACAIHSVFGDDVSGEFVKANARAFLLDAFGDSAEIFELKLQDPAVFQNLQDILWKELLKPCASLTAGIDNERFAEQEEGKMIWDQLLHTKPNVYANCIRAAEEEAAAYQSFKQKRNGIVEIFGTLCTRSLEFIFVRPLLESLDIFNDFCTSVVVEDGRSISKLDALFESGARSASLRQSVVEHYGVDNFDQIQKKVADIVASMDWSEDATPVFEFCELLTEVQSQHWLNALEPFPNFSTRFMDHI